jgi:hypothetical protein
MANHRQITEDISNCRQRRRWIEGDNGFHSKRLYLLNKPVMN